ncbi:hypothetical protein T02_8991 [Trichinella nativa]|uniref:Uncharacterized protein n=1 Tax=Trichinella nativa TaxID=6335 RepID=A0A0V1L743_9BILA|nr:hypothetical protein T02_8991 [Trichinella nativa]
MSLIVSRICQNEDIIKITCVSLLTFYIAIFENNDVLEFLTSFSYIVCKKTYVQQKIGKFIASSLCKMCWNYIYVQVKNAAENFNDYMMRRKTGEEKYRFKCMTLA